MKAVFVAILCAMVASAMAEQTISVSYDGECVSDACCNKVHEYYSQCQGSSYCAAVKCAAAGYPEYPAVDCEVSEWSTYESYINYFQAMEPYGGAKYSADVYDGQCSKSCGSGSRRRYRYVTKHAAYGGKACPSLDEVIICNPQPCPVNCVVGEWVDSTVCSVTCGTGTKSQLRKIVVQPAYGGVACPLTSQTISCSLYACPVDCVVSDWTQFTAYSSYHSYFADQQNYQMMTESAFPSDKCSASCGGGITSFFRRVVVYAQNGGKACPAELIMKVPCNTQACPVDCIVASWTSTNIQESSCSKTCGSGSKTLTRQVIQAPSNGGVACPALTMTASCNTQACPVDCVVSEWTQGQCSVTCGSGYRSDRREIKTQPSFGGLACPPLTRDAPCNQDACPGDCIVSQWNAYYNYNDYYAVYSYLPNVEQPEKWIGSVCSATCGGGVRRVFRRILQQPSHGGVACPALEKSVACNTDACPADCVVGEWVDYKGTAVNMLSSCSKTCGSGIRTQVRSVSSHPQNGGAACPPLTRTVSCNQQACPVDCVVAQWTVYSTYEEYSASYGSSGVIMSREKFVSGACSVTCGGGVRSLYRHILVQPASGGVACPALEKTVACNVQKCPSDCKVSDWVADQCPVTCGGGIRTERRQVVSPALYGGVACPPLTRLVNCNEQKCPVDCKVTQWTSYTSYDASYKDMSPYSEVSPIYSSQSFYSASCSKSCGSGVQQFFRRIIVSPSDGGRACPLLAKTSSCNVQSCPIDCVVAQWTDYAGSDPKLYSSCSRTCGGGVKTQVRNITVQAQFGGVKCPALQRLVNCNEDSCPVDCEVGTWTSYGSYEAYKHSMEAFGECFGPSEYGGVCSKTCGGGSRRLYRQILTAPAFGGAACPLLYKEIPCSEQPCPIHCVVSDWTNYPTLDAMPSICSVTCGGGYQLQFRQVSVKPAFGGYPCPSLTRYSSCNEKPCYTYSHGGAYGVDEPAHPHNNENDVDEYVPPAYPPVPAGDCEVSFWTTFSTYQEYQLTMKPYGTVYEQTLFRGQCSSSCGSGLRQEFRYILKESESGKQCPPLIREVPCNTQPCPVDCQVSSWSSIDESMCSASCGGGLVSQKRSVLVSPAFGGVECPALEQRVPCNTNDCPIDCVVGSWADSVPTSIPHSDDQYFGLYDYQGQLLYPGSVCTKSCGGGVKQQTRRVLVEPAYDGAQCPDVTRFVPCNEQGCPGDCIVSEWASASTCSVSCGGGLEDEVRTVIVAASNAGKSCPSLARKVNCNTQKCPVDCVMSSWTFYNDYSSYTNAYATYSAIMNAYGYSYMPADAYLSQCNATCGSGVRTQVRFILNAPQYGGKACASQVSRLAECNLAKCPGAVDCLVSDWFTVSTFSSYYQRMSKYTDLLPLFTENNYNGLCSLPCGGGSRRQFRTVLDYPQFGGDKCPELTRDIPCNAQACTYAPGQPHVVYPIGQYPVNEVPADQPAATTDAAGASINIGLVAGAVAGAVVVVLVAIFVTARVRRANAAKNQSDVSSNGESRHDSLTPSSLRTLPEFANPIYAGTLKNPRAVPLDVKAEDTKSTYSNQEDNA